MKLKFLRVQAENSKYSDNLKGIKKLIFELTTEKIDATFFCVSRVISHTKVSYVLVSSFNLMNLMSCYIKNNYLSCLVITSSQK